MTDPTFEKMMGKKAKDIPGREKMTKGAGKTTQETFEERDQRDREEAEQEYKESQERKKAKKRELRSKSKQTTGSKQTQESDDPYDNQIKIVYYIAWGSFILTILYQCGKVVA